MKYRHSALAALLTTASLSWQVPQAVAEDATDQSISTILKVGSEGRGNAEAAKAWQSLSQAGTSELTAILSAMDQASPLAANYLKGAVDAIVEQSRLFGR